MIRELKLYELLLTANEMLNTEEEDGLWSYYEENLDWWALRLYTRIN